MHMKKNPNLLVASGVVALIMALALGAAFAAMVSQTGKAVGASDYLVDGSTRPIDEASFRTDLAAFARDHDITVTLHSTSADAPLTHSAFYIAERTSPGGTAEWLNNPPTLFLPDYTISAHPYSELTELRGGRGLYSLDPANGDGNAALTAFVSFLDDHGLTGQPLTYRWVELYVAEPATIVLAATALLCLALGTLHSVLRAREHGIRRLQGQSSLTIAATEHLTALRRLAPAWIVIAVMAAGGLYAFNRFHGLVDFLSHTIVVFAVLLMATSIGFFTGLAVTAANALLGAIKGQLPLSGMTVGVWAIRLCALLILLVMTAAAQAALATERRLAADADLWHHHDQPVAAFIAGSSGESIVELGPVIRDLDREGQILMTNSQWYLPFHTTADMQPVVLMNATAAIDSGALTPDEATSHGDTALIAIPDGMSPDAVAPVREHLQGEFSFARENGGDVPEVTEITIPRGRSAFTYATSYGFNPEPASVDDPIVIVLPPGMTGISDYNLAAAMTQATILLRDRGAYDALAATDTGHAMLAGSERAIDRWAQSRKKAAHTAAQNLIGALIAMLLTTATVAATALTHHLHHARKLHVHALMGHHPIAGRGGLVVAEVAFALVVVAWLVYRQRSYLAELAAGTARGRELADTVAVHPPLVITAIAFIVFWALITTAIAIVFDEANLKESSPA